MAASKRRRSDRALRPPMCSPGRPTVGRREHRQRFWEEVARGLSSEKSAVAARRVSRCWRALVSPMWWHATFQSSSFVGALPIVRRARRDCGSSCWRLRRARDRPAVGPLTVDDLARTAAERSNTKWKPRVSSHSRPMACRSTSETSESCQTRCKQRTEAVCAGSPWRPDRGSRRGGRAGPQFTLGRASPWSPTRPAVGGLVESRADRQQATGRLSR